MERGLAQSAQQQPDGPAGRQRVQGDGSAADERKRRADEREVIADERERRLDNRTGHLDAAAESRRQDSWQSLERARALLVASEIRLNRTEALLRRDDAQAEREQAEIDRLVAESQRILERQPPDPAS